MTSTQRNKVSSMEMQIDESDRSHPVTVHMRTNAPGTSHDRSDEGSGGQDADHPSVRQSYATIDVTTPSQGPSTVSPAAGNPREAQPEHPADQDTREVDTSDLPVKDVSEHEKSTQGGPLSSQQQKQPQETGLEVAEVQFDRDMMQANNKTSADQDDQQQQLQQLSQEVTADKAYGKDMSPEGAFLTKQQGERLDKSNAVQLDDQQQQQHIEQQDAIFSGLPQQQQPEEIDDSLQGKTAVLLACRPNATMQAVAAALAKRGASVILTLNGINDGQQMAQHIKEQLPSDVSGDVVSNQSLDFMSMDSIYQFAEYLNRMDSPIDILINDANVTFMKRSYTPQGVGRLAQVRVME